MDRWSLPQGIGTGAALTTMGWPESTPSVGGRKPGEPFQLAPTSSSDDSPRWPLYGITPAEVADAKFGAQQAQAHYEAQVAAKQATQGGTPTPGATGAGASMGGDWAGVDQWNAYISAASGKTGVPVNLLKAIMKLESGGSPENSPQGATGLMQIMPDWNGKWGLSIYNDAQNVEMGARILQEAHDNWAAQGAADPWQEAIRDYIGRGGADAFGTDQNSYYSQVKSYWDTLNAYGSGGSGAVANNNYASTGNALQSMFGVSQIPDWGEFNVPSDLPYYTYGNQYGLSGNTHTGLDVPMNPGSPYYAPIGGVVTCAGTGYGSGTDGGGCSAFNCVGYCSGGSAGRVEVLLDNGAILIYGHSSTSALAPGTRFNAGTLLGTSGGENSGHVHLEARVRDASMPSGWRIVDPRSVLGGGSYNNYNAGATGAPQQQQTPGGFGFTNFWLNQYGK